MRRLLLTLAGCGLLGVSRCPGAEESPAAPLAATTLHHAFRVTERLLSGSQPEGDAAFAELVRLGVKTIVSVDGAKPDVEAARKYGLRYIHLPIGYDGVPPERFAELARAASVPGGQIYVHCHHGLHRGPAAVAVMCEATADWTPARAEAWLRQAGTAAEYAGLYRSVREFQPLAPAALDRAADLPEVAKTPPLVEAMVALDERLDLLKAAEKARWQTLPGEAATLLWEQLRELARTDDTAQRPADYRKELAAAVHAAETLRDALRTAPGDMAGLDAVFQQTSQSCTACHRAHRNKKP